MSNQAVLRIVREISQIHKGGDLSLAIASSESDVRFLSAMIIGPPDTPYEFGFFEFKIKFSKDYPACPPKVTALTTDGGRTRFNPNIYADGKVCLSILGTWRGESGEQWSSAQGLESILISIQSLMSANPYENEPGYERAESEEDKEAMAQYVAKIRHETLRTSVIKKLESVLGLQPDGSIVPPRISLRAEAPGVGDYDVEEPPRFEPFCDLYKRRFLWYYSSYEQGARQAAASVRDGQRFKQMPFEIERNTMSGSFHYSSLLQRLARINDAIMDETARWREESVAAAAAESRTYVNLRRQHEQIVEDLRMRQAFTVDLALEDDNPFVWTLTYFGKPMTHLDGGIFHLRIALSPRFPDEQPRVFVLTPGLFHHRISPRGVLCYFPRADKAAEDMRAHVDAILHALEDEEPPFDPRATVNPEAARLFWGSPDERRQYNRALRRSVQRTSDM